MEKNTNMELPKKVISLSMVIVMLGLLLYGSLQFLDANGSHPKTLNVFIPAGVSFVFWVLVMAVWGIASILSADELGSSLANVDPIAAFIMLVIFLSWSAAAYLYSIEKVEPAGWLFKMGTTLLVFAGGMKLGGKSKKDK